MKQVFLILSLALLAMGAQAKKYSLTSPDEKIKVEISVEKDTGILAMVFLDQDKLMDIGPISMDVAEYGRLGIQPKLRKVHRAEVDQYFNPVVKEKRASVQDSYRELSILFRDSYQVDFRVYNDGVAYRFRTDYPGKIQINDEEVRFGFAEGSHVYYPTEESFFSHNERAYEYLKITEIPKEKFASLPALVDLESGSKILLTESHLEDYPGLYIQGSGGEAGLTGTFPRFVTQEQLIRDRDMKPIERASYLAQTAGTRTFPWRVAAIAQADADLVGNDIVLRLAPENRLDDTSWIKPGIVSWDWWNATNNVGVPFKSGVNTATYKYHIDFAADYGLEYIILDEGWSVPGDLFKINPECDLEEITSYAAEKGVGVILWVLWNALDRDLDRALDQFQEWGVKGIKVDFMQRDDQAMVNYYWKVAKAAAQRELLVDYHGSYKPTGLRRAYPNVVNREGLKGLENAKWSALITPDHDCTLPFIRMVAGPMDYTPGAMRNAQKINYAISFTRPMSQGTRCHQLALYVLYDSPIQMLCDLPSHYYKEPLAMEFLSVVPAVWDETIPLFGKVGDYLGVARQSGDDYFLGVITDWSAREFDLNFDFLPDGEYELTAYHDGLNAERYAEDFASRTSSISRGDHKTIQLASGGGWVGVIKKIR